jgi:hypothetical protein
MVKFTAIHPNAVTPTKTSIGYTVTAISVEKISARTHVLETGLSVELPPGHSLEILGGAGLHASCIDVIPTIVTECADTLKIDVRIVDPGLPEIELPCSDFVLVVRYATECPSPVAQPVVEEATLMVPEAAVVAEEEEEEKAVAVAVPEAAAVVAEEEEKALAPLAPVWYLKLSSSQKLSLVRQNVPHVASK